MMTWSRKCTLIAGAALILATNAVALIGVAYNRGTETSVLKLSERELRAPRSGWREENSALEVGLDWRVLAGDPEDEFAPGRYGAAWLDEPKLASLGVDVKAARRWNERWFRPLPEKAVLIVLELDGAAYQEALRRAQARAARDAALAAANPDQAQILRKAKRAEDALRREQTTASRLFAIDAGLDFASLRAKYPDATRYAVVRGLLKPSRIVANGKTRFTASLSDHSAAWINVPLELSAALERSSAPVSATIAFGKRFEPWIIAVSGRLDGSSAAVK